MEACIYRIKMDSQSNEDIEKAMDIALGVKGSVFVGKSVQNWQFGMCKLLTQWEGQPMACHQPEKSESNCPDIQGN